MTSGHCLCGAVEYSVSSTPIWSCHCHCNSCRRNSGAAVASFVAFANNGFQTTQGEMAVYESSPGVKRYFCSRCGTPMAFRTEKYPTEIHLFLGTLANPEDYPARFQVFCANQLPWLSIDNDIKRYETLPPE